MEGYLPVAHAVGWTLAAAPFVVAGARAVARQVQEKPESRLFLGVAGAYAFLLSALKLPSVTGSSSHPTGLGLGVVLFGPGAMALVGSIVLLFQALLLGHGGISTLGANAFSMAIVGPWVAWGVVRAARRLRLALPVAVFLAGTLANLATYMTTAFQLALAFPDPAGGLAGALVKYLAIFALTQIPLAIGEGLLTVLIMNQLVAHSRPELRNLAVGWGEKG